MFCIKEEEEDAIQQGDLPNPGRDLLCYWGNMNNNIFLRPLIPVMHLHLMLLHFLFGIRFADYEAQLLPDQAQRNQT
jgi:hypothetical protein